MASEDSAGGADQFVFVKAKSTGGSRGVLHTNRDCSRLKSARKVHKYPRSSFPDDASICEWCSDTRQTAGGDNRGLWNRLESMDPDDLVTDGGVNQSPGGTKRIHFLTDVEDLGAAYRCLRCDHVTATKVEMYEHRKGFLSRCFRTRLKQKVQSLHPATDQGGDDGE